MKYTSALKDASAALSKPHQKKRQPKKANEICSEADFGALEDIDWYMRRVDEPNGKVTIIRKEEET